MILEMRIHTMKAGTAPQAAERLGAALSARSGVSPLAGCFQSEVGPLNQIIMMWQYRDLAERDRCDDGKIEGWPPDLRNLVTRTEAKILIPAPFSPPIEPRRLGEIYEIRQYTYAPGSLAKAYAAWETQIEARQRYSPLVFAGTPKFGAQDVFIHVWAYQDAVERQRIRTEVRGAGVWPPRPDPEMVTLKQQNALVVPTAFSPWH